MKYSLILSTIAIVGLSTVLVKAQVPTPLYSFETLYDSTNTPNPAGTRPDDFNANGGGTTITQSTIGVTDGSHSLGYTMVGGATFTGAQTSYLPAALSSPETEAINFDLTIPATGNFTGAFARIGISEFGTETDDTDPPTSFTDQVQTVADAEKNIDLAPGTYNLTIPLEARDNPVTFQPNVPFSTIFGNDSDTQIVLIGFEFYINKSSDAPLTVYIDNVKAAPLLGDTNDDFKVDSTDLATVMANYGKTVTGGYASGDFNGDGVVNADDFSLYQYGVVQFNFLTMQPLPEPAGMAILGGGVFAVAARRRRSRSLGVA